MKPETLTALGRCRPIATIFADGVTDDSPGLQAALDGEPVLYDGRVYLRHEGITVEGREVLMPADSFGPAAPGVPLPKVTFVRCHVSFAARLASHDRPKR